MKITALNGSPKRNGNTETLLDAFLRGATKAGAEIKKIRLSDLEFKNCRGCNACHKKGTCILNDDLKPVFDEVMTSDILVLASPIYSMTVTAEMKAFIDRGQFLWAQRFKTNTLSFDEKHLSKHIGVFLSTAGQDLPFIFDAAFPTVRALFNDAGFTYAQNVLFSGMDLHGGAKGNPERIKEAEMKGAQVCEMLL